MDDDLSKTNKKDSCMDKYNAKTSFQKWFLSINFEDLSSQAQLTIENFDYYSKKTDFQTILKVLLHTVYEEFLSFRESNRAFIDDKLHQEVGKGIRYVSIRLFRKSQRKNFSDFSEIINVTLVITFIDNYY